MTYGDVKMVKKMRTPNMEVESIQKKQAKNPRSIATATTVSSNIKSAQKNTSRTSLNDFKLNGNKSTNSIKKSSYLNSGTKKQQLKQKTVPMK